MKKLYRIKNLSIADYLRASGASELYIERHSIKYIYFLNLILIEYHKDRRSTKGYARIYTTNLKVAFGNAMYNGKYENLVSLIPNHLCEWGVIRKSSWFESKSRRAVAYKISDEWFSQGLVPIVLNSNEKRSLRLLLKIKSYPPISSEYIQLASAFQELKIDKLTALTWIYNNSHGLYKLKPKRIRNRPISRTLTKELASHWDLQVDMFDQFYFSTDKNTGRVYSNICSLPSPLRHFVYIIDNDGKRNYSLFEIDIKNAQPLLLAVLIEKQLKDNRKDVPEDVLLFKNRCENGKFYDSFKKQLKKRNIKVSETFKEDFFTRVLFNKESGNRVYRYKQLFDEIYPTVGTYLSELKSSDYKKVSYLLQSIESQIIVTNTVKVLLQKGVFCVSLHDAIICTVDDIEIIKKAITMAFSEFGVVPALKVNRLGC